MNRMQRSVLFASLLLFGMAVLVTALDPPASGLWNQIGIAFILASVLAALGWLWFYNDK